MLDHGIVEKACATRLPWAGWTYRFAKQRKAYGLHIVLLLWTRADGQWRILVGFRLWRPKRSCGRRAYTAGWCTKKLSRFGWTWHGTPHPDTLVYWRNMRLPVCLLAGFAPTRWRTRLGPRGARAGGIADLWTAHESAGSANHEPLGVQPLP